MSHDSCIGNEALVDYLYGEADADERRRVEAHVQTCARCADELGALTDTRRTIEAWEPPGADLGFRVVAGAGRPPRAWLRWRPAWALAAAAVLVAVAAALIVRPEVELRGDGMVLRIGWSGGETGAPSNAARPSAPGPAAPRETGAPSSAARSPAPGPAAPRETGAPAGAPSNGRPSGLDAAPEPAVEAPPGPTVPATPAGLRSGGGAAFPGPRVGPGPDPMTDDELLRQVGELIREDAAARRQILEYARQAAERR